MTTALLLLTLGLALVGMPLFAAVAAAAMILFHQDGMDLQVLAIEANRLASIPILVALPFFTYTGVVLAQGSGPERLVRLARAVLGRVPGGIAIVTLGVCTVFSAFTGASGITIVALGGLLLPLLRQAGVGERFALGLVTTGGSIGLLFPPSLAIILYGVVARVPIDDLYKAAFVPGLIMLAGVTGLSLWSARPRGGPALEVDRLGLGGAFADAAWDLPLPIIVLGGIYTGHLTVVEASTLSAVWVTGVQAGVKRAVHWRRDLPRLVRESMGLVGAVVVMLAVAQGLTSWLIDAQIPERAFELLGPKLQSRLAFLLALNGFLLLVGCMMDLFSAVVVIVPLLLPLAAQYGVDPLHLGVIFLANLELGYLTPPVGLNLFIASLRFERSMWEVSRAVLPFLAVLLATVLLITWLPWLSLWWR